MINLDRDLLKTIRALDKHKVLGFGSISAVKRHLEQACRMKQTRAFGVLTRAIGDVGSILETHGVADLAGHRLLPVLLLGLAVLASAIGLGLGQKGHAKHRLEV